MKLPAALLPFTLLSSFLYKVATEVGIFLFPKAILETKTKQSQNTPNATPAPLLHVCVRLCQKETAHRPGLKVDCKILILKGSCFKPGTGRSATQYMCCRREHRSATQSQSQGLEQADWLGSSACSQ